MSERRRTLAAWLREGLVKLGPTFIKIGQQFSTRVDVLSPEFVKELEMLQDNVPAFSSAAAVATVERGLGKPILEVFEECVSLSSSVSFKSIEGGQREKEVRERAKRDREEDASIEDNVRPLWSLCTLAASEACAGMSLPA